MQIDDFIELARTRRTIRKFKPDPVPDEYITKILEAARWAQSGANGQPWEYLIIKSRDTVDKIIELWAEHRRRSWAIEATRIPEMRHTSFANGLPGTPGFKDAPVIIMILGDPRPVQASVLITHYMPNEGGPMAHFLKDMGNTTQIMTLAAAALGLASQWVSVNCVTEISLKRLLDIPDEYSIPTMVPIGYPAYMPPPTFRRELSEIVHHEKYDRSKFRSDDEVIQFLIKLRQRMKPSHKLQ